MKAKLAFIALFVGIIYGCDPTSTQDQIVKNSTHEDIVLYRYLVQGVFRDTLHIVAGTEQAIFKHSDLGSNFDEESCPELHSAADYYENDTIVMITFSGKTLKKNWFDENNWESTYTRKNQETRQECRFEVLDEDFE